MEKRTREFANEATDKIKETVSDIAERTRAAGEAALDAARDAYRVAEKRTSAGMKYTDKALHRHPYEFACVAFSIGVVVGFLLRRR